MKTFEGIVVADKMQKTVVLEVSRKLVHPLYKKVLRRSRRYKADTGSFEVTVGDRVRIAETRPIAKGKYFKVIEIIGKGSAIAIPEMIVAQAEKEKGVEKVATVKKAKKVKKTEAEKEEIKK